MNPKIGIIAVSALIVIAGMGREEAFGQSLIIYPAKGQSEEQQSKDRFECHSWAVDQSGFDPSNPPQAQASNVQAPQPEATEGGVLRGGARGAALGAVGGAIAGDAGKGAAIGAATGALFGGMRRNDQRRRQQQEQQNYQRQVQQQQAQQQQANAQLQETYNRAMTACLEARGYSVS
ncbi:MAG: glycine zipper domain-containing protein [Kiloniellales bacterium]|nr:glycine zipper domain-containing protein [Kiloniellales bacterium]